jgi:hypothetical protein
MGSGEEDSGKRDSPADPDATHEPLVLRGKLPADPDQASIGWCRPKRLPSVSLQ